MLKRDKKNLHHSRNSTGISKLRAAAGAHVRGDHVTAGASRRVQGSGSQGWAGVQKGLQRYGPRASPDDAAGGVQQASVLRVPRLLDGDAAAHHVHGVGGAHAHDARACQGGGW